ncbi:hypothetical protein C6360_28675 [Bacillus wiedmannii]|nr:hypothetical protein C6360_28675 [Bacillus wiedmannii]
MWIIFEPLKAILSNLVVVIHKYTYLVISWVKFLDPSYHNNNQELWATATFFLVLSILIFYPIGFYHVVRFLYGIWQPNNSTGGVETNKNVCEKELSAAIKAVEKHQNDFSVIHNHIVAYMKAVECEIKEIFALKKEEFQCLWIIPDKASKNKEIMKITYLEDDITDFTTVDYLIQSSLCQDDVRICLQDVKDNFAAANEVKQFTIIKNYGKFKLGFMLTVFKEDTFTSENMQEFENFTAYMLTLGFNTKLTDGFKRLSRNQAS